MGGTIGGLPYPTGDDRVYEGDNAIQALAAAVNMNPRGIGANLIPITYGSGWAALGNGVRYVDINGWIWLAGRATRASGSSTSIGTMPNALAPIGTFWLPASGGVVVAISSSGVITADSGAGTAGTVNLSFATSWPKKGA